MCNIEVLCQGKNAGQQTKRKGIVAFSHTSPLLSIGLYLRGKLATPGSATSSRQFRSRAARPAGLYGIRAKSLHRKKPCLCRSGTAYFIEALNAEDLPLLSKGLGPAAQRDDAATVRAGDHPGSETWWCSTGRSPTPVFQSSRAEPEQMLSFRSLPNGGWTNGMRCTIARFSSERNGDPLRRDHLCPQRRRCPQ